MNSFRITRSNDKKCWILEEPVTKPSRTGKVNNGNWRTIGYYGKLSDLAVYLLNRQIEVPAGTLAEQVPALIEAIKAAEMRIAETLAAVAEG